MASQSLAACRDMDARSTSPFREGGAARQMVGMRCDQGELENSAAGGVLRIACAMDLESRKTVCRDREERYWIEQFQI